MQNQETTSKSVERLERALLADGQNPEALNATHAAENAVEPTLDQLQTAVDASYEVEQPVTDGNTADKLAAPRHAEVAHALGVNLRDLRKALLEVEQ